MEMTVVFDKLMVLQDILAEKYRLEELIQNSPKQLQTQDELLSRLKKEFIEKSAEYDTVRAKVGSLKAELAEAESARENGEKGMDSISTHREYEALDKEIRDATDREQQVRKDLQKEDKNLAELNETLKQEEQLIESQEAELNAGKEILANSVGSYEAELKTLTERESEITATIDDREIIFKFERIIKSKQNRGIVAVKGNVCNGCHMILPAEFANRVRSGKNIEFCPYCSRILYYQELDSGETEYFQVENTGSLADLDSEFDDDYIDEDESNDLVNESDEMDFDD